MSQITNIVLTGNNGRTQSYMIQMLPSETKNYIYTKTDWSDIDPRHLVVFDADQSSYICNIKNDWYVGQKPDSDSIAIPFKSDILRLYFPDYSADTYDKGCKYILTAYTYIAGIKIELGSFLFRRNDSLACAPREFGSSDKYYEYIDFSIADPYDVQNSYVMQRICGRKLPDTELSVNDVSSELYLTLQVVENVDDHYIKKAGWTNGQNNIQIVDYQDLKLDLEFDKANASLDYSIIYNTEVATNVLDYIKQTYDVNNIAMNISCVVMDESDAYIALNNEPTSIVDKYDNLFHDELIGFSGQYDSHGNPLTYVDTFWSKWKEGVWIRGSVEFINIEAYPDYKEKEYEPFVTILSNIIPVTQDIYAIMNTTEDDFPRKINWNNLNMTDNNINVINSTTQETITVTPTDSTKSHIIQPIFYQTRNIGQVMIHPEVTENISINLDSYKSNVKTFSIKIENGVFSEIGRTTKGIVFKIIGNELQNQVKEGTLYVLDQNGVLVTTGKYIYVE